MNTSTIPRTPSSSTDDDYEHIHIHMKPQAQLHQRQRQQTFELTSPPPSQPPTPAPTTPSSPSASAPQSASLQSPMEGTNTPARNRSFLNLTSSTLFGIYQHSGFSSERGEESATPWGTGAQTPARREGSSLDLSRANQALRNGNGNDKATTQKDLRRGRRSQPVHRKPRRGFKGYYLPLAGRVIAMFGVGVLYGLLITQLYDRQEIAPTIVDIDRSSWAYLTWWGLAGALLGEAMPWVDTFWAPDVDAGQDKDSDRRDGRLVKGLDGWIDIVRSIGAFVGVAFAIRKLPWQSTLQLSLTLALANPAIWYIVDRSPPGFVLSSCFALGGTLVLLGMNPALMPSPSPAEVLRAHVKRNGGLMNLAGASIGGEDLILGIFTQDSVGVATWIASVLFVSSVCFGNIGRRLAPQQP